MNKLLISILLTSTFVCQGQTDAYKYVDFNDTKEIKGLFYLKADTTLVTGKVIRYNNKGKAKRYVFVKNGVPDNLSWIYYNDSYESPKESVLGSLVTGAAYVAGAVMAISGNDINVPLPINNTNKINHSIIQNDVKDILDYNKEIASTAYDDMSQGDEISENLQLNKNSDIIEKPSDRLYQKKDDDSQVIIEGNYIKGIKEGLWQEYYKNGQLRTKGIYIGGKKDGLWREYHENGNSSSEVNYKEGKKVGLFKNYYSDGQIKGRINYKEGKEHGLIELYHENGKLMLEGFFKDANQISVWKYYNEEGKLINLETFDN